MKRQLIAELDRSQTAPLILKGWVRRIRETKSTTFIVMQDCSGVIQIVADPAKVNPNGGAIALGHPIGATGCILTIKAIYELQRTGGRYALVTMCIGGGQGIAGIFERL